MKRALRFGFFWVMFPTLTCILFTWLVLDHYWKKLRGANTRLAAHHVATVWSRWIFRLTPGWRFVLEGRENLPAPGEATVMVSNHASAVDIWAVFMTECQFRWLSKAEVFRIPVIGTAMRWAGYVPIKRGEKASYSVAMDQSSDWLRQGVSMIFFPEGTRSVDGKLRPFKSGAFRLAEKADVPILPIALIGTNELLEKRSIVPKPATVTIRILPPSRRQETETQDAFIERIREDIRRHAEKAL